MRRFEPILRRQFVRHLSSKSCHSIAFDVDGVLLRGPKKIEGVVQTLQRLHDTNVPYLLLTNGGGTTEEDKAKSISKVLGFDIAPERLQLAHTPFRELAESGYADKPVLLVGKKNVHKIAAQYGFKKTYDISDLHHQYPALFPDWAPIPKEGENGSPLKKLTEPIAAVLTFMDPTHYHRDLQVVIDVLRSNGFPDQQVEKQQVPIFFSGPDLEYVTDFKAPRFGSGIFQEIVQHLYEKSCTRGSKLQFTLFGKPTTVTYQYAQSSLLAQAQRMGYSGIDRMYMVGDNPKSDIAGANHAKWHSVLVCTGMYMGGANSNDPQHPAQKVVPDVNEAVRYIEQREKHLRSNKG